MYRWTTGTKIPLEDFSKTAGTCFYNTIIGTTIWMMIRFSGSGYTPPTSMFVINTETNKIRNIEFNRGQLSRSFSVQAFTNDGSKLYMICESDVYRDDERFDYTIYVMDTTERELEWFEVLEFSYHSYIDSCQIIGNTFYLLSEEPLELITIDLTRKKPMKIEFVMERDTRAEKATLTKKNDTLYAIVQERYCRTVLILENNAELEVVQENRDYYSDEFIFVENGNRLLYKQDFPRSIDLKTYDFANDDWITTNGESTIQKLTLKSAIEYNNKIYVFVTSDWHDGSQHEIRVLDLNPNLSSICWLNFVDEAMLRRNVNQIEKKRNQLPVFLRSQMDAVVNWRIAEKEKDIIRKLLKKRFLRMSQKIQEMRSDSEISEKEEKKLIALFRKEDLAYTDNAYEWE